MNEITIQTTETGALTVSSREVAEHFEKEHFHVLRDIQALEKDLSNFGLMFIESEYPDTYGRPQKEYLLTRDGFSLLAMGFTGKAALEWKLKYIDAFNRMEAAWNSPEAVMSWALKMADKQLLQLKQQIDEDRPKVLFAESVSASQNSILVGELAKLLRQNGIEMGQNRLFRWMREHDYLMKIGSSRNLPTQRSLESGWLEIKETTINNPDGSIRVTRTPKVTGKGQVYFVNLLNRPTA
ncbi:MAG: phage regulatory protein/antirepressor Ant [Eubacteriales bacterium]|nr:phage regulatory protein/antirepressor Ant [Eubacteriales bacterium]